MYAPSEGAAERGDESLDQGGTGARRVTHGGRRAVPPTQTPLSRDHLPLLAVVGVYLCGLRPIYAPIERDNKVRDINYLARIPLFKLSTGSVHRVRSPHPAEHLSLSKRTALSCSRCTNAQATVETCRGHRCTGGRTRISVFQVHPETEAPGHV